MKYNEVNYEQKITELYNGDIELVGKYKGWKQPILVKDKYGVMKISEAGFLVNQKPGIKSALNKTSYFMNMLKEAHPEIWKELTPVTEYVKAKEKMMFDTMYGLVTITPDALINGHMPNVRSAVDRKDYMYRQLKLLYKDQYDFRILSTSRHEGKCVLICPIHGEVLIDNDYVFSGSGCPKCNSHISKSNILYIVKLSNDNESFYKLGITYRQSNGNLQRYQQYKKLGYNVEEITTIEYETPEKCAEKELKLKHLIKPYLYQPKIWPANNSTETFTQDLLTIILQTL